MHIGDDVDRFIMDIICDDGGDPCGDHGGDDRDEREPFEEGGMEGEIREEVGRGDTEEREASVIDHLRKANIPQEREEDRSFREKE